MTPLKGRKTNELGLDSLRGLAALMVFVYHLRWIAGEPALRFAGVDWQPVLKRLDLGVCLFFVLSGYLLSGPFWDGMRTGRWPNLGRYGVRRLARILPAYWLLLVAVALLSPVTYTWWGMTGLFLQAAGLHTFADYIYLGCVPVLWSIGIELQYYVLLPAIFAGSLWLGRRRAWSATLMLVLLIAVLDPLWRQVSAALIGVLPNKVLPNAQSQVVVASVFFYLKWFGVGIAAAGLIRSYDALTTLPARWWDAMFLSGIVGLGLVVAFAREGEWRTVSTWGWPVCPMVCGLLVLSAPRSRAAIWALENGLLRFLGRISYGVYLWHWPLQKAVFGGTLPVRLGSAAAFFICGAISLFFTCLIAWLSNITVEAPAIAWAKSQTTFAKAVRSVLTSLVLGEPVVESSPAMALSLTSID